MTLVRALLRLVPALLPAALVLVAAAAPAARAEEPAGETAATEPGEGASVSPGGEPRNLLLELFSGRFLDPDGAFWRPRRGDRTEVTALFGAEAALFELGNLDRIPTVGGTTLTLATRYYPVDRLAITVGAKTYLGLDRPAAGTTASTVLSPFAGVRWDLVRENRFSLLADIQSGPAFFVFADFIDALSATWAVGAEASIGFPFRYSLGPWTAELRPFLGGRVGSAPKVGRPQQDVGPFSALYGGADLGLTWSFGADEEETRRHAEAARRDAL